MLAPGCESRCPGCAHRELSAVESETQKSQWLNRALAPWASVIEPLRAVEGEKRLGYRDKTVLFCGRGTSSWEFGMRIPTGRRREYDFIAIPDSPVHSDRVRNILRVLSEILPLSLNLAFVSVSGALITLVLKQAVEEMDGLARLFLENQTRLSESGAEGIYLCFNASAGQRVFLGHWNSRGWRRAWGNATSVGSLGLKHGPQSFQQLIPALYDDALTEARNWLKPTKALRVIDLYSGIGASMLRWKNAGAEVAGVELLGEAVELSNEVIRPCLLQGRASERITQLRKILDESPMDSVLFANPPRLGMEPEVAEWIGHEARPSRIAYLSCSAGTLARDLSKLENCAYRVKRIIPYDFFPQTSHVETLACLELDSAPGAGDPVPGKRLRRAE